MGTISDDILYASQQINVPLNLPYILKQYAKAAIKTQPRDLLNWSSAYFRALANGDVPPVKDRIEYPLIATPSGLTAGFLRVLIKQFGKSGIVEEKELINKWKGVGLELDELQNMLRLCGFRKTVRWLNFVAVAAGFLSPNLTQTMILICELLTDEPEGGSAAILHQTFMTLYIYLARMDCGPICHLKSNMDDTFSEQVSAEDLLGKADDEVETEKSSEKLSEIEVALERKPTLDSNNSSNGVMVWEDVTHPDLVQEKTGEETVEENAENLADNMPVDVVDEPTTVVDEEEKADDQESVKSTESYDNTGITLKFHDSEQDVKIDDYTGPIEPKLKKRFEKKFGEEQEEETEEKPDADETKENGDKDDKEEEKEGEEQEQLEEKENEEEGAKEETKEDENKRDSKAEDEVDHKEEDGKENGDKTEEVIEKIEEGCGDEEGKEEEEGDKKEVEQEVKGNGEENKEEEGNEEKEEAKEAEVEGKKVEEEEKEGEEEKKKEVEEDVKEGEVKEGKVEEGEEEEKKDVKEEVKEGEEEKKKEDEEEVKEIEETKETDKKEKSGETEKTPTPTTKRRKKKSAKKEGENEVETKEEGEEEESDHEEQSRYEYSLELEEEEERVGEEEKSVKEELKEVTENIEEVEEKMAEEEEEKAEEEGEEEELKEEESVELKMTDSAIPLQGQRKSNIEVYGSIHLPKHRNLSFTDSIVSEPDNHFWANVPGIGALVPEKQILTLKAYFLYCSEKQNGFIMPRNIKHHLCPSLEPPVVAMEKRNLGSSEVELINREGEHKRISF